VLDALADAPPARARDVAIAGAWRVLAELGVAPTVDACAECDAAVDASAPAVFSHPAGGILCAKCGHLARSARTLPPEARVALRDWLAGRAHPVDDVNAARAHQRLLREFLREHLADERPLGAFDVWERDVLSSRVTDGGRTA